MIDFNKQFESELVVVRPTTIEDYDEMSKLTTDSEMWIYFTSDLSNPEELRQWIKIGVDHKSILALTILDKETQQIVGSTSIGNISEKDRRAEIGRTWISKKYQGKGYNSEVKLMLIQYLFEEGNFERVELKTDVLNMPARMAMLKIGLVEEGVLRSHMQMIRNRRRDSIYYSVLREEWAAMKTKNNWGT